MGRHKADRIDVPKDGEVSKKALQESGVVYWGTEPTVQKINPLLDAKEKEFEMQCQYGRALNWYSAMADEKMKRKYAVEYCEKYLPKIADAISKVSTDIFLSGKGHTYSSLGRLFLRGWPILKDKKEKIDSFYNELAVKVADPKKEVVEIPKPRDPKVIQCIGLVDATIDSFVANYPKRKFAIPSMADTVLKAGATNAQRTKVHEHFAPLVIEFQKVISGKDKELEEAYAGKKDAIKMAFEWMTAPASEVLVASAKKSRKPRKKKVKTTAQILKLFTYQKSDSDLKVTSIDPETILGAQQLWIFNTKSRKLGVYHAKDDAGLQIHRKSIDNYDEERSISKKIRKPKDIIPNVVSAGKVALRHLLEEVRAVETPMKALIGETVLLLRVVK